jgi:hypothetical protein
MLPEPIIHAMAEKAAEELLKTGALRSPDREKLVHLLQKAFSDELNMEKTLLEEVDRLLEQHKAAVKGQRVDLHELRYKMLQKLARDKGVVLR